MLEIIPKDTDVREVYRLLVGGIGPRPIALVSTLSPNGVPNLSPFSFFNMFGANPPMIAFSPTRRGKDMGIKDTLHNLRHKGECTVQSVTYDMVEQVNLASAEYPPDIDEFAKSGLTPIKSDLVEPFRVKESPFQMECRVSQIIELGQGAISGNLVICEVVKMHIDERIVKDGTIDTTLIDLVGRNGGSYYTRAFGDALFEVPRPAGRDSIGFDRLPAYLRNSRILTGNDLARLADRQQIPSASQAAEFQKEFTPEPFDGTRFADADVRSDYRAMLSIALSLEEYHSPGSQEYFERTIRAALRKHDVDFAWKTIVLISK